MRKVLAWLGVATLVVLTSASVRAAGSNVLKPYVVLILDTSGSMADATGSGPPSCGGPDTKLNHARCAINQIVNSYGDMVFAFARFRETATATGSGTCGSNAGAPANCTLGQIGCLSGTDPSGTDHFQLLTPLVDGNNADTAKWTDGTCNTCTPTIPITAGQDPEEWEAEGGTPIDGALSGSKCYWQGLDLSTSSTCAAAGTGTAAWPSGDAGFAPILNDPDNNIFLSPPGTTSCNADPSSCDASAGCTGTNCCCVSQCRPYIVILLTDGDETCDCGNGGSLPACSDAGDQAAAAALLTTDVGGKRYRIVTDPIGYGIGDPYTSIEDIAHAGGHVDIPGQDEGFYANDEASLKLAISKIIEGSIRSEQCNGLDDDCDGEIDEDFPLKGQDCDDGKPGVCKGTGKYVCTADGTGVQCNITNPGQPGRTTGETCPAGDTCSPDGSEICGNGLDDDCDGDIDEGCTTCTPSAEICNGKDDDCDGKIDEDVPDRACGNGSCTANPACCGTEKCVAGAYGACSAITPAPETCNNVDDDCDGLVDEGLTESCSNITGGGCTTPPCPGTNNPGDPTHMPIPQNQCHPGTSTCVAGAYGACINEVKPQPEICNGLDDDCDNVIDEDTGGGPCNAACGVGTIECATAPTCCQPGSCLPGQHQCGTLFCSSTTSGSDYTCDQMDDDCDGQVDEDWTCDDPTHQSSPAAACGCTAPGICNGQNKCINGMVTCVGTPVDPASCCDCNGNPQAGSCNGGSTCASDCRCEFPCGTGEFPCPVGKKCDPNNFCVDDPCYSKTCPPVNGNVQTCVEDANHQAQCVDTCTTVTCPASQVCYGPTGQCAPNDCRTFGCSDPTQHCVVDTSGNASCVSDPCSGVTCPGGQYCQGGQCYGSCSGVTCPTGQRCRMGTCQTDPCGQGCPSGQVCNDASGQCENNPCTYQQCQVGQWCNPNDGMCEPDPCIGVTCPAPNQVCEGGTCYDHLEADGGQATHVTVGGGGCDAGGGSGGLWLGLAAMLLVRRRRDEEVTS